MCSTLYFCSSLHRCQLIIITSVESTPQTHYLRTISRFDEVQFLTVQISAEDAQRALKDLIFSTWAAEGCESRTDTLKMVSLVDFFLPFLPLERRHVQQLFSKRLLDIAQQLMATESCSLSWDTDVIDFLADKVGQCRECNSSITHPSPHIRVRFSCCDLVLCSWCIPCRQIS